MLFATFDFLLFFVPVAVVYWALAHRDGPRVLVLLAASYFFYVAGPKTDPPPAPWYYVGLLVFSTVLNFSCAKVIDAWRDEASRARQRRGVFAFALLANLGLLAYFKYTNFCLEATRDLLRTLGVATSLETLSIILPLGISFFTFQSLSYTIDVYRGRLSPEPSFVKFALFVAFFPQLVAGPILRASDFLPQLHRRPNLTAEGMQAGLFRIAKGLVKKVVLGDFIAAQFTDRVFDAPTAYTSAEILLALYAFTLQLYADFSGYSDLAIGVARLLGYELPENFDRPYTSKNVGEFWRRWHMTLSTWLRDYLFFPLGGSKGGPLRTYFNLWLTMVLVGMWHGASWNFVVYSLLHAFAMVFHRWLTHDASAASRLAWAFRWRLAGVAVVASLAGAGFGHGALALDAGATARLAALFGLGVLGVGLLPRSQVGGSQGRVWHVCHVLATFHFTVLTRAFFRADDLTTSRELVATVLAFDLHGLRPGLFGEGDLGTLTWVALLGGLGLHFTPRAWIEVHAWSAFRRLPGPAIGLLFAILGYALMRLSEDTPRAFIYFAF